MSFPFPILSSPFSEPLTANNLQRLRQAFINNFLFAQIDIANNPVSEQLSQIARILGQTATNESTVYDNGTTRGTNSTAGSLTLQVERALTQVLGRSPGRGADGFVSALNSAFPATSDGSISALPTRSLVSLYSPTADGLTGQLSVEQANLYRQGAIIGSDALKVLEALKPFNPTADLDAVEALRSLVRSQIRSLIDEFGRLDEPRRERVENFLSTLLVKNSDGQIVGGSLRRMGEAARLTNRTGEIRRNGSTVPVTVDDETQIAGYELLISYIETLDDIWERYDNDSGVIETQVTGRYSERLSRASVMLPVISDSNASFMSAMDSVGFIESERRSEAARFTVLESPGIITLLPDSSPSDGFDDSFRADLKLGDMTLNDFDEWVERFTSLEAPSLLSTAGQFGLDFVTDQADTLFWTIAAVLYAITPDPNTEANRLSNAIKRRNQHKLLGKVLSFERVQQTLSELVFQLDTLADLGLGSTSASLS